MHKVQWIAGDAPLSTIATFKGQMDVSMFPASLCEVAGAASSYTSVSAIIAMQSHVHEYSKLLVGCGTNLSTGDIACQGNLF